MKYEIFMAPEAVNDLKSLTARNRSILLDAIEKHLRYEPDKISRSRIKRLRGTAKPQYRLRVGEFRVFFDVAERSVEVLAIIPKTSAIVWLEKVGKFK
ncbi:MAG: type II toxin-antitoxin system RelE/ParE family toxin [Candidatus Marinimicrobia bacterium]|nr:type II toxin-antitoxin system RelE/ParE family toxin [Candidatus Neomarinimicrobiota bacterium]MCH8025106.1 type II toxin-antitoxin system RelE/ParE family toxin [Candidatus Neomarinimicrobiota bacterium]